MIIAIIGSRDFSDYQFMKDCIFSTISIDDIKYIVSGGARGADTLAEKFAIDYSIPIKIFPANWEKFGKSAGFIRNTDIINNSDIVFAFPIGESKGTYDSINKAKKLRKPVYIFDKDIQNVWKDSTSYFL